jgi:hypothetical protein
MTVPKIISVKGQEFATKTVKHQISPKILAQSGVLVAKKNEEFKTTYIREGRFQ